jgi:outer membrane protein assembly factor BamB
VSTRRYDPRMRARRGVVAVLAVLLVIAVGVTVVARSRLPAPIADDVAAFAPGEKTGTALAERWRSVNLDGAIYARPVVAKGLVIAATENNSLYGLDAKDGQVVWGPTHIGNATPIAELNRLGKPEACGNIDPLGITGAPGIDEVSGTVFAVAEVLPGGDRPPVHQFVGVDAATGQLRFPPLDIDPPGVDTKVLQQRPALLVANGFVYVGFGGLAGDCGDYHGWLAAVPVSGTEQPLFYEVAPEPDTNRGGAIWAPAGPSIDSQGNVFVATGNSFEPPPDPAFDRGDAVIKLSPQLDEIGWFAPSTFRADNDADADLGSTSPVVITDELLFQIGKRGTGYLIATTKTDGNPLGGVGGEVASADICPAYGGTAYRAPRLFVACTTGIHGVDVGQGGGAPTLTVRWRAQVLATGPPVADRSVVWSTDPADGALFGLDAETGRVVAQRDGLGTLTRFSTPTIVRDTVVVAAGNAIVAIERPESLG